MWSVSPQAPTWWWFRPRCGRDVPRPGSWSTTPGRPEPTCCATPVSGDGSAEMRRAGEVVPGCWHPHPSGVPCLWRPIVASWGAEGTREKPAVLTRVSSPARAGLDQGLAHRLVPEAVMPVHLPVEPGHPPLGRTHLHGSLPCTAHEPLAAISWRCPAFGPVMLTGADRDSRAIGSAGGHPQGLASARGHSRRLLQGFARLSGRDLGGRWGRERMAVGAGGRAHEGVRRRSELTPRQRVRPHHPAHSLA